MKRLKLILGFTLLIVAFGISKGIGRFIGKSAFDGRRQQHATIDDLLWKASNQINAQLPMTIDSETRLDSTAVAGKSIIYHYTLVNHAGVDLVAADLGDNLYPNIRNSVCTAQEMKIFRDNGVTVSYRYTGNDGTHVTTISIKSSDCLRRSL